MFFQDDFLSLSFFFSPGGGKDFPGENNSFGRIIFLNKLFVFPSVRTSGGRSFLIIFVIRLSGHKMLSIKIRSIPFSFPLIREGRGMLPLFPPKGLWGLLGPNPVYSMGEARVHAG